MEVISEQRIRETREMLLKRFRNFVQALMDDVYYDDSFHGRVCDFLQDSGSDKLLVLPRAFLKTTIVSLYMLWKATKKCGIRILSVSNTMPNAQKTVRTVRAYIEGNQMYQLFFPDLIPDFGKVRWSDTCACVKRPIDHPEGTFESAGVGSNVIRRHFNLISEDDTVAPKKDELTGSECMPSKDDIEKAVGFHKLTIPLLIDEGDERIITATRWASYDLVNHILESEKKHFSILDLSAYSSDGKPRYKRFGVDRLQSIKDGMGTYMFSCLYLNQPLAKEFMAFNPDFFRYYEEDELPEDGHTIVTIDPADPPTGKKSQNHTGILSAKHTKSGLYIRRYRRKRLSDKGIIAESMDVAKLDEANKIRIETNRYAHLEAGFKEEMAKRGEYYIIETVKAKKVAKEYRIQNRLSPLFENGVVWMKRNMRELEQELTTFPYGKSDDLIDALSWQIERYYATEYKVEKKEKKQPHNVFTLEQIRKTMRGRTPTPYPFQRQMELQPH